MVINVGTLVASAHMDTQLQEYMDLALRWTAILYLKNVDRLFDLVSASGARNADVVLFHKLGSFRGIAALSVDGFDRSWKEFKKFVPMFRLVFETETMDETQQWAIWMRFLDQM